MIIASLILGTAILLGSLFLFAVVAEKESPLMSLVRGWTESSKQTLISLALGIFSMAVLSAGYKEMFPLVKMIEIWQALFIVYVVAFGAAYTIGGLYFSKKVEVKE